MKTIKLLLVTLLFMGGLSLNAQNRGMRSQNNMTQERYEKIMQKKMLYMKENLMLTPEESKAFEELYKSYAQEKMMLRKNMRKEFKSVIDQGKYLDMSDRELNKVLDRKMELENKRVQIELNFHKELRKILPPQKVVKYYKVERMFNKRMMEKMKRKRELERRRNSKQKRLNSHK
jgi:hypothetical protein